MPATGRMTIFAEKQVPLKKVFLLIFWNLAVLTGFTQILTVTPANPITTSHVTIVYDATRGNGELMGYTGDVYTHTGLITTESQNGNDWKHVVGNWGSADSRVLMQRIGSDLYQISFTIDAFYSVNPQQEQVLDLAFVFRNEDGSLVGRTDSQSDIFYSINQTGVGNYVNHHQSGDTLIVHTTHGTLSYLPYTPSICRVSYSSTGQTAASPSLSVVLQPQHPDITVDNLTDKLVLTTDSLKILINKNPVTTAYFSKNQLIASEQEGFYTHATENGVKFNLSSTEVLQGTGSRAIPINRRGYQLQNWNQAHYGYSLGEQNLNISIPLVISSKGYALFFDNPSKGTFDLSYTQENVLDYACEKGQMTYYFIQGSTNDALLNKYTNLTGKQPLPALWNMGYFQSRFGYENESHARTTVNDMINGGFPIDAIILDLYWFGDPGKMGNLQWNYSRFHNPVGMINDFKSLGVKTILITEPYFTQNSSHYSYLNQQHFFGTKTSGETYVLDNFWVGSAALLDFTKPEARNWMWNYYKDRKEEGVAGWWSDLGEPENHPYDMMHAEGTTCQVHNLFSLLWAQMLFKHYQTDYPGERLFNLIRSGYAGMQRYSTFPWSGDIQKTWEGLQTQIPIMVGMSMSGVGYMGSDLGGFTGDFNPELYTRWIEQGTFSPIMRAHGVNTVTEPVYLSEPYKTIARNFIRLRYQLLPYNYTLAYQNSTTGRPLALPMDYFEPGNPFLNNINDQYFWGENLLAAPVVNVGERSRSMIFPTGKWINFFTNETVTGESIHEISAPLGSIPLFVKAGAFLPMATPMTSTDFYQPDTLLVWYYPDLSNPNTTDQTYFDNGHSTNTIQQSSYDLVTFIGKVQNEKISISLGKKGNSYPGSPQNRELMFEVKRTATSPDNVSVNGNSLNRTESESDYLSTQEAWYYNNNTHILQFHFNWDGIDTEIIINGPVGIDESEATQTLDFTLHDPYPNPFSDMVSMDADIARIGDYQLKVVDTYGHAVFKSTLHITNPGRKTIIWDGKNNLHQTVASHTYLIILQDSNGKSLYKKVVLIR